MYSGDCITVLDPLETMFLKPKISVSGPDTGIGSGFNQVSGSGSGIRIQEGKNRKIEKGKKFQVLKGRTTFKEA